MGETYNSSIEMNAVRYGYKAANLIYLDDAIREFEASLEAARLHKLYGDIRANVPGFKPVDADIIALHLNELPLIGKHYLRISKIIIMNKKTKVY